MQTLLKIFESVLKTFFYICESSYIIISWQGTRTNDSYQFDFGSWIAVYYLEILGWSKY